MNTKKEDLTLGLAAFKNGNLPSREEFSEI